MTNTTNACGQSVKIKGSACILPIKPFTIGEALESGQWRCHNGGMYVVCKAFDGKLAYPDSKYFKGPYGLEDVLNGAIQPCAGDMLCLCPPIWGACNTDGSVCVPAYDLRACAWDYDPVLKEYRLYTSLKADNHIKPYEGSIANPKTWDGGYDVCGYLNRPVAKDLDGNLYYPGDKDTIFCGVQCSAVDNPDFTYANGKLRVNFPATPTPVRIVAIDDSGTQTTITLSDGTVISGPEVDKDDYVVSYVKTTNAAGESILTITMKSGATHSVTLPAAVAVQDTYITGLTIDANGLVTATRNNGLPSLTAQIQFPEPTTMTFPMIGLRGSYTGGATDSPPVTTSNTKLHFNMFINATGGFSNTLNQTDIIIPKTGWYRLDHRCTAIYTSATPPQKCRTDVILNGVRMDTLGINFGTNFFPDVNPLDQQEAEKSMYHYCSQGDVITVETGEMSPGAEIIGETLLIKWESI